MPVQPCPPININDYLASISNPANNPNFLNPNAAVNPNVINNFYLKIYYTQNDFEDFASYYVSKTLRIRSVFNGRGNISFQIADDDQDYSKIHFIPLEEMYVEIVTFDDTVWGSGYIRSVEGVKDKAFTIRPDYTEAKNYLVTCTDLYGELERASVKAFYTAKKHGWIFKDVVDRYTSLDGSEIDTNIGYETETYPIFAKKPSQILTHVMQITDTTYIIDPGTRKIKLSAKGSSDVTYPDTVTDVNVYRDHVTRTGFFDAKSFSIGKKTEILQNVYELHYTRKYNQGRVNVADGDLESVVQYSTEETGWVGKKFEGQKFKLKEEEDTYSVVQNLSIGATREITISPGYKLGLKTNKEYEIIGGKAYITERDWNSINQMIALGRGNGEFVGIFEEKNPMTDAEAQMYVRALAVLGGPLTYGKGVTNTFRFQQTPVTAGMVFKMDLPKSNNFIGNVVCQAVDISDPGGSVEPEDHYTNELMPYWIIDFDFTTALSSTQLQFRKAIQDLKKPELRLDYNDEEIINSETFKETYVFRDCFYVDFGDNFYESATWRDDWVFYLFNEKEDVDPLYYTEYNYALNGASGDYAFSSN